MARAIRVTAPSDTVVQVAGSERYSYNPNSFVPSDTTEIFVTRWVNPTDDERERGAQGRFAVTVIADVRASAAEINALLDAERQDMLDSEDFVYGT